MAAIKQDDLIESVADAFQYISYYHPKDYIDALALAYEREESSAAKDAIAQILTNSKMSAQGRRPMCQDTGLAVVFVKLGMEVKWSGATMTVDEMIHEGVRRAYTHPDNTLRASVVKDPANRRVNSRDNTPAVIHYEVVAGSDIEITVAAKGGGSENKAKFTTLMPSDSLADWIVDVVPAMGAGWCPPGMLGIGVGGTAEKAMLMAKESLMESIDMQALKSRGPQSRLEELRIEIYDRVNALGIGAQG
ncbi:MAG: fumarate hydratase, partial [Burkholderiales bacterium]|nr:fumarate hydratase [Burkholderiales bacterium]